MTSPTGSTALDGRVALVTGASSGIGAAAAMAFAMAGARVLATGRDQARGEAVVAAVRAAGGTAAFVSGDLASRGAADRIVAATVDLYGRLDCAFNNAATSEGTLKSTVDFTDDEFDRVMAVNLRSVHACMRAEIAQLRRQEPGGGAIVNTSSVNGLGGAPLGALYSAAKAGVLALTKSAAQELASEGIRVNALVAGAFDTPMLAGVIAGAAGDAADARAALEEQYVGLIPMRRIGRPEEAAAAAVWLCSPAASYVTGHSLIVDGGMSASMR